MNSFHRSKRARCGRAMGCDNRNGSGETGMRPARFALALALGMLAQAACLEQPAAQEGLAKIKTIVVIYGENRSFDHMYGFFPSANGIANATEEQKTQLDHDGKPLPYLVVFGADGKPDPRFPKMPNAPFRIDAPPVNGRPDMILPNPIHAFYHNQEQINGG